MPETLDGLFSFFASHHAIRAEKVLAAADLAVKLIPGPKDLSPNCGVALRFRYDQHETALAVLADNRVQVDEIHRYRPSTDDWPGPERAGARGKQFWPRR